MTSIQQFNIAKIDFTTNFPCRDHSQVWKLARSCRGLHFADDYYLGDFSLKFVITIVVKLIMPRLI